MTNQRRKQIRKRRQRRSKNKFAKWFRSLSTVKKCGLIIGVFLLAIILLVVGYVKWGLSRIDRSEDGNGKIEFNNFGNASIGEGYTNFVLFGGDSRSGDVKKSLNTDTIIIVSLNNKTSEIKMVSVYRDTLLDISTNNIRKCNSAYSNGGAIQAVNMLNKNLDLTIEKFVTVNFKAVVDLVDMVDGVEVDVSDKEWREVNKYIDETGRVAGKRAVHLTHGGVQKLDGVQATTYARIRKNVGDDYARTDRQRLVIEKVLEKTKEKLKTDPQIIHKIITDILPEVYTNLDDGEILDYAANFAKYKIGETTGFPFEKRGGKLPGLGDSVYAVDLKSNVVKLHEFLFGTEDYQPSSTVVSISKEIAYIVGNRGSDSNNGGGSGSGNQPSTGDKDNSGTGDGDKHESGSGNGEGGDTPTATQTDI